MVVPAEGLNRLNLAQALHIGHAAHGGGDGHEHQGDHDREQQVEEDVADGLDGGAEVGDDHADEGADQDAAEDENQVAVLLPEALLLNGCHVLSPFPLFLCALLLGITGC